MIVIEEAHRLLRAGREGRASAHAVELFASMLAEIRAYGEGLVIAEQIPAKLVPDAVKNTALKVVHRLPARDDRDLVGAAMNLDEDQSRQVVSLPPGVAAVFADGMDRPVRVRVPFGGHREAGRGPGPPPPLAARRGPACGPVCTGERACTLLEMRRAELLASAGRRRRRAASPATAWLRLWAETLVLAFLTSRGLPAVPAALRRWWPDRRPPAARVPARDRGRPGGPVPGAGRPDLPTTRRPWPRPRPAPGCGCSDAGRTVRAGHPAGPGLGDPAAALAARDGAGVPARRPDPRSGRPRAAARLRPARAGGLAGHAGRAPAAGAAPPPAVHRAAAATGWSPGRRCSATTTSAASSQDLATVGVGLEPGPQLRQAAGAMEAGAWLEVVLSWPRRFMA